MLGRNAPPAADSLARDLQFAAQNRGAACFFDDASDVIILRHGRHVNRMLPSRQQIVSATDEPPDNRMLRMHNVGTRIRSRREAIGLSQTEIAQKLGVSRQAVSQWEAGKRAPAARKMGELASLLDVPADWLWTGRGGKETAQAASELSTEKTVETKQHKPEVVFAGPLPRNTVKDLPVYGSAEGGDGVMVLDNDPIEYIERPAELQGVPTAYAVYVVNDSMSPLFEPGDKVLVHPGKPVLPGKDVLFVSEAPDGTRHALIKRLVRSGAKVWRVKQFNPPSDYDLPKAKWQRAHRVVGVLKAD